MEKLEVKISFCPGSMPMDLPTNWYQVHGKILLSTPVAMFNFFWWRQKILNYALLWLLFWMSVCLWTICVTYPLPKFSSASKTLQVTRIWIQTHVPVCIFFQTASFWLTLPVTSDLYKVISVVSSLTIPSLKGYF